MIVLSIRLSKFAAFKRTASVAKPDGKANYKPPDLTNPTKKLLFTFPEIKYLKTVHANIDPST